MNARDENGFTLVEVVVAAGILVLFMGGLYQIMSLGLFMWEKGETQIDEQQNLRIASNHIARELRTAYSFDIGVPGKSENPRHSIEMRIPAPNLTPNNYPRIRYYFDGGNEIQRSVDGKGHNIVAYGIRKLEFCSNPEKNIVVIKIQGIGGYRLETQVFIRANNVSFLDPMSVKKSTGRVSAGETV